MCLVNFCDDRKLYDRTAVSPYGYRKSQRCSHCKCNKLLEVNTIFYYVPAVISIVRNVMQGIGDQITPLVSSGLEMVGKVVIAFTLVPLMGYAGVIVAEPIVWFIMVIPLLVQIIRTPKLKANK